MSAEIARLRRTARNLVLALVLGAAAVALLAFRVVNEWQRAPAPTPTAAPTAEPLPSATETPVPPTPSVTPPASVRGRRRARPASVAVELPSIPSAPGARGEARMAPSDTYQGTKIARYSCTTDRPADEVVWHYAVHFEGAGYRRQGLAGDDGGLHLFIRGGIRATLLVRRARKGRHEVSVSLEGRP